MSDFYDTLESRDAEAREAELFSQLPDQIRNAQSNAPGFARILDGVHPDVVSSRAALASLPVTRKSAIIELQRADPPFGGLAAASFWGIGRIFASPGPIYEPEGRTRDYWRMARALWAAGVREGDLVHNTFAYHFTPAGLMLEGGAHAIGCTVFPAGTGQSELQARTIADLRPSAYVGTPSFLNIILDRAAEIGADVSSIVKGLVSGEALPPRLRAAIAERGVDVLQCYATADVGLIAYESPAREGLILDESIILEIVRPGTGDPVPEGEVGEVVVTTLNPVYPLVRFGTGDLSAILPGESPCGRTNARIKGWLGRADQTTKVKGMFVHPEQIAAVAARHSEIVKARLVVESVDNVDRMTLHCEVANPPDALAGAIAESVRDLCKLGSEIAIVEPGTLANDGKVIEDARSYE